MGQAGWLASAHTDPTVATCGCAFPFFVAVWMGPSLCRGVTFLCEERQREGERERESGLTCCFIGCVEGQHEGHAGSQ